MGGCSGTLVPSDPRRMPLQIAVNLSVGLVAAMAATLSTQPMDVVRARMQLRKAGVTSGSMATFADAFKQHGMQAFMSGTAPRFFKRSLQTALVWTMYEELVPLITQRLSRSVA